MSADMYVRLTSLNGDMDVTQLKEALAQAIGWFNDVSEASGIVQYETADEVFVIQSEGGDIVDVTTNREFAQHLVRKDDDNPYRTLHEDTLWVGPERREDWDQ